jgi:hypothetical protein
MAKTVVCFSILGALLPACGGDSTVVESAVDADVVPSDATIPDDALDVGGGDQVAIADTVTAGAAEVAVGDVADGDAGPLGCPDDCDDKSPCTVDSCADGKCVHAAIVNCGAAPCGPGLACAVGTFCAPDIAACVQCAESSNCGPGQQCVDHVCVAGTPCTSDVACKSQGKICNLSSGFCSDCQKNGDCGSGTVCVAGACQAAVPCASNKDCPHVCDLVSGTCVACNNANDCSAEAYCNAEHVCVPRICQVTTCALGVAFACTADGAGYTAGTNCSDANACTTDTCVAGIGCSYQPSVGPCDDGSACTMNDTCLLGACQPGSSVNCDDKEPCTADSCDVSLGCVHFPTQPTCQDGNVCTVNDTCTAQGCVGVAIPCGDKDDCTLDSCDPASGCVHTAMDATPCNDNDFCTTGESCVLGVCQGVTPTNCDDGDPCSLDVCDSKKGCLTVPATGASCSDGNACTANDKCSVGKCQGVSYSCSDNNACTSDGCDPVTGCTFLPMANYCSDGNYCTVSDTCVDGACVGKPNPCDDNQPCTLDSCSPQMGCQHGIGNNGGACEDGNPCTTGDACAGGTCKSGLVNACDDGDMCTHDGCLATVGCIHPPQVPAECTDNDVCTTDECSNNTCVHATSCCKMDADCKDADPLCTTDTCVNGTCKHTATGADGCCDKAPLWATFEGDISGFTTTTTNPGMEWYPLAMADGTGGNGVLAFGAPTGPGFTVAQPNTAKAVALSPVIALGANSETTLSFAFSTVNSTTFLNLRVSVIVDGTSIMLVNKVITPPTTAWQGVSVDLSPFAGKSVQLQFEGSPLVSASTPVSMDILIDNIHIAATCLPKPCTTFNGCTVTGYTLPCNTAICSSAGVCTYPNTCCISSSDCNDANLCTTETCYGGKCYSTAISGCCANNKECDDGNPCTTDTCPSPGGGCSHVALPGCCTSSLACNDSDACTTDYCLNNGCVNKKACCGVDLDCSDGESICSVETCVKGTCQSQFTGAKGCCNATPFSASFDQDVTTGISFNNSSGPSTGWQIWQASPQFTTGPGVLYYGNPATKSYAGNGTNYGTATLPALQLAADVSSTLSFELYLDVEAGSAYDLLTVSVNNTVVWDKGIVAPKMAAWQSVSIDLSKWKGQVATIQFSFNTVDGVANSGFGVAIDGLKVTAACQ